MQPDTTLTTCTPTPAELEFLEDRLYEYNSQQTGQANGQLFAFFLRDEQQNIKAGITGWTWAQACEIQNLWVHTDWRGQGCGRALLEAAEQEARLRGCKIILLTSYSFQAPGFYQKCGFDLVWQLADFPPGHQHCILVKRLGEADGG